MLSHSCKPLLVSRPAVDNALFQRSIPWLLCLMAVVFFISISVSEEPCQLFSESTFVLIVSLLRPNSGSWL